jgi:hypothetical protein
VLQQFVPMHAMVEEWQTFDMYRPEQLYTLAEQAQPFVERVEVRGL